ncbi:MAG TPA: ribonuclease Z, partial [Bacteroidia bacterium]|nr:ribonuclease Z [Bacteroidia bacterium]
MAAAFELTILGSSSATPTSRRFPTAQLLNIAERFFLIDCGEATQIQLRRYKIRFQRINHIFISHLHGDHYLGLMGLLSSLHLLGRRNGLTIYAPEGLRRIIELQFELSGTVLNYAITWNEHDPEKPKVIFEDQLLTVETIMLEHRIPCYGFIFREKPKPLSLDNEKIEEHSIPKQELVKVKRGEDAHLENGTIIPNKEIVKGRYASRSYAFASDTRYSEKVTEAVKNVDLLYHESTFLHEMLERAEKTFHSTALQAATVANKANV